MRDMTDFDVVIIGAGPSGSVAGAKLIQEGYSVLILEKMIFPRFVIGESLLPQSMDYLEKTKLLPSVERCSFQVKTGVTFYHNEQICEFLFKERFTEGWDYTYQVKRADFDKCLIDEVERMGADVRFACEVTEVNIKGNEKSVSYKTESEDKITVTCDFVIDASGYGRVLPRLFDLEKSATSVPRGSIFTHVTDNNRTEKASENIFVHAFRENTAWIWSIPFSDNTTSVGIVGDVDFINECALNNGELFLDLVKKFPGLEGRFEQTDVLFDPRKILNYSISVKSMHGEGFVLCGNSTEFLDPVFSSGVTLAIASGYEAAVLVDRELKGETVDWETEYAKKMKEGIEVFRSYVDAWYNGNLHTIFFVENGNEDFKKQICSVLAGYVWDTKNPFVKKHKTLLTTLAKVISMS